MRSIFERTAMGGFSVGYGAGGFFDPLAFLCPSTHPILIFLMGRHRAAERRRVCPGSAALIGPQPTD
ncbi:MAG: hypothetical protein AAGU05_04855, partial [Anaerolineaceae bacterium]